MKNKKVLLIIIILVLAISLGTWGIIKYGGGNTTNNTPKKPTEVIVPKFQTIYQIVDICNSSSDEKCKYKDSTYYRIDDFNQNPDFEPILHTINSYYINRKTDIENSLTDVPECAEAASIYKYRYQDKGSIYYYVSDKIAVVAQYLQTIDLCTNKKINPRFEVYYYDVEWQKMTDEDGLLKLLNLKRENIESKIIAQLVKNKLINDKNEFALLIKDNKISYKLFIDMVGNMVAGYNDSRDDSYDTIYLYSARELNIPVERNK